MHTIYKGTPIVFIHYQVIDKHGTSVDASKVTYFFMSYEGAETQIS